MKYAHAVKINGLQYRNPIFALIKFARNLLTDIWTFGQLATGSGQNKERKKNDFDVLFASDAVADCQLGQLGLA
jgi:hypothetical protein